MHKGVSLDIYEECILVPTTFLYRNLFENQLSALGVGVFDKNTALVWLYVH